MKNFLILSFSILLISTACSKGKKIKRRLDGDTWKIVKIVDTYYDGNGNNTPTETIPSSSIEFKKDGTCIWDGRNGTYNTIGPAGTKHKGSISFDFGVDFFYFVITEYSRTNFTWMDDSGFYSGHGNGTIREYFLEKE